MHCGRHQVHVGIFWQGIADNRLPATKTDHHMQSHGMVGFQRHDELRTIFKGKYFLRDGAPELLCGYYCRTILTKKIARINHEMKIMAASRCIEIKKSGIVDVHIVSAYRLFTCHLGLLILPT